MNQQSGSEAADLSPYLNPTATIDSQDPKIQKTAKDIVGTSTEPVSQIRRLIEWIQEHVEQVPVDVFASLQVLEGRKAECQGLTWLYTAFARSLGIPTRVTNGLVYSQELEGFLYHTWAESYVGAGWLPVDPTFSQIGVDATHIKLLDGDRLADLLPLVDIVGKIRMEILSYRSS
jgi:transglutaminase-like putative cysteine protease